MSRLRFSANISMLFPELEFTDRFAAASRVGFNAVECLNPCVLSKETVAGLLQQNELELVLFNFAIGDWEKGERGISCLPGREQEFRESLATALAYAKALRCKMLHCMAGIVPADLPRSLAWQTMVANLRIAAQAAEAHGIRVLVEPINNVDIPGYLLNTSKDGIAMIDAAAHSNVWLQYDVYHMQRMEGNLAETLARLLPRIAHIQIADSPNRHEPGTGDIDFPSLFLSLQSLGYCGWIGAEYRPKAETLQGLDWFKSLASQ